MTPSVLNRLLSPLARRLRLMVGRALVSAVSDSGKVQAVQVKLLDGEVRDGVEVLMPYGHASHPPGQPEGLYFAVGGDRDHGVMICLADRQFRLRNLAPGESALYDDLGQVVHLTRDGILIKSGLKVRVEAPDIEWHATHSWSWDVGGLGERWTALGGGAWEHHTWQAGASVSSVTSAISPPEGT